jgi:hypothetical protein
MKVRGCICSAIGMFSAIWPIGLNGTVLLRRSNSNVCHFVQIMGFSKLLAVRKDTAVNRQYFSYLLNIHHHISAPPAPSSSQISTGRTWFDQCHDIRRFADRPAIPHPNRKCTREVKTPISNPTNTGSLSQSRPSWARAHLTPRPSKFKLPNAITGTAGNVASVSRGIRSSRPNSRTFCRPVSQQDVAGCHSVLHSAHGTDRGRKNTYSDADISITA